MRRLFFDRSDGRRIKHKDPILRLIPYIMPKRYDAQVFFDDDLVLDECEKLIKSLRKEGHRVLFLHIVLAAILRTMVEFPKANRFVVGRKVYARNEYTYSFAMKKAFTVEADETVVKVRLNADDTLFDVVDKINQAIVDNRQESNQNETDKAAKILNLMPGFLLRFAVFIIRRLDNHRLMPKFLINASPFHSSAFVTDLGSLGIKPVYHHIYDFGTTSFFIAFGTKEKHLDLTKENEVKKLRKMSLKIAVDERICDGYYFAQTIKRLKSHIKNPQKLLEKPTNKPKDEEIA